MAEFVLDPVEKVGARLRIQNIGSDGCHTQLIRSRGERCSIAAGNCNTSAFGNKPSSSRKANPAIPPVIRTHLPFNNMSLAFYREDCFVRSRYRRGPTADKGMVGMAISSVDKGAGCPGML
jgi:hypothetical protein